MRRAITTFLLSLPLLHAQEFSNFTFDEPDLSGPLTPLFQYLPQGPFQGSAADLLPGWTLLNGDTPITHITYAPPGTGASGPVTLFRPGPSYWISLRSSPPQLVDLRIMQSGRVPNNASSLSFFANGPLEMLVNGELIHRVNTEITVFPSVDVSRFAGQTVDLEFRIFRGAAGASFNFDITGFTQVPEPSTLALAGVGGVALACAVFCRRG